MTPTSPDVSALRKCCPPHYSRKTTLPKKRRHGDICLVSASRPAYSGGTPAPAGCCGCAAHAPHAPMCRLPDLLMSDSAPVPAPQCFMQPCSGRQVTLRVLNCLPHMTACYLHATDIVAMLKHDYPDICLEPLGTPAHRQPPISACAAPRGPLAPPAAPHPPCLLHGSCGKPGSLTIHSTLAAAKSVLYACPACLSSIVDTLREMGHVNIYVGNVLPTWWPLVPPAPSPSPDA